MTTKLSKKSLERAIDHICTFGDTDVFPHLPEISFLNDCKNEIVAELGDLDLEKFQPVQAIEALSPKSSFGFRIVHQLQLLDTVLFTAATIEIAPDLEKMKESSTGYGPFAYRYEDANSGSLFKSERTYRDWLKWQASEHAKNKFDAVVFTDIADFFHRIYLHRVENCLDSATANKGMKKFIENTIKTIRSKQSFGIPVGGSASRIIAEAVLADSDAALLMEGFQFSRYVDDFRIFLSAGQNAYQAISFLAEQLYLTEGMTLNGQKTRVLTGQAFTEYLQAELPEKLDKAEEKAFEALAHIIYFEEAIDQDAINELKALNLVQMLKNSVEEDPWDFGEIKAIFRALRIVESSDADVFIIENFQKLLPFAKELLLYFDSVRPKDQQTKQLLNNAVELALRSQAGRSVSTVHTWLLEFFVRSVLVVDGKKLEELRISSPLCDRQVALIMGLNGDVNFFRRQKTKFDALGEFAKSSFILGATCLPNDEFSTWIEAVKPRMDRPLDKLFCKWAKTKTGKLKETLALFQKRYGDP